MTPAQCKLALLLYSQYKTDTAAYAGLARAIGISVNDLNKRCWEIMRDRRREAERLLIGDKAFDERYKTQETRRGE